MSIATEMDRGAERPAGEVEQHIELAFERVGELNDQIKKLEMRLAPVLTGSEAPLTPQNEPGVPTAPMSPLARRSRALVTDLERLIVSVKMLQGQVDA